MSDYSSSGGLDYVECEYCSAKATHQRFDRLGPWFYCPCHAPKGAALIQPTCGDATVKKGATP